MSTSRAFTSNLGAKVGPDLLEIAQADVPASSNFPGDLFAQEDAYLRKNGPGVYDPARAVTEQGDLVRMAAGLVEILMPSVRERLHAEVSAMGAEAWRTETAAILSYLGAGEASGVLAPDPDVLARALDADLQPDEDEILDHASELAHQMALGWSQLLAHAGATEPALQLGLDLLPREGAGDLRARLRASLATFVLDLEGAQAAMAQFAARWFEREARLVLPGRVVVSRTGGGYVAAARHD